jgi:integrase
MVYRVRVRRKGYAIQIATFCKLSEAKQWAQITEGAVVEGHHFPTPEAKRHTVADLIGRYGCEVLPHKNPSTIKTQKQHLHWWQTHLGHYLLADITPAVLVEYRSILARGRANATVVRYLAVLSHAFTMAMREWQWCEDNPVRKISKPKEPKGRVRFLSEDERERLLNACKVSRCPYLYTIVVLALSTGAGRGDLLNLCWADVDMKASIIASATWCR